MLSRRTFLMAAGAAAIPAVSATAALPGKDFETWCAISPCDSVEWAALLARHVLLRNVEAACALRGSRPVEVVSFTQKETYDDGYEFTLRVRMVPGKVDYDESERLVLEAEPEALA